MLKKTTYTMFVFLICILFFSAYPMIDDIIIIGNENIEISTMNKSELKNIYLGQKLNWDSGKRIVISMLVKSETEKAFNRKFLNMTLEQFVNRWRLLIYSGKGKFPKVLDNEEMLVDFVSNTKNAVGYISSGYDISNKNVKEITITE